LGKIAFVKEGELGVGVSSGGTAGSHLSLLLAHELATLRAGGASADSAALLLVVVGELTQVLVLTTTDVLNILTVLTVLTNANYSIGTD